MGLSLRRLAKGVAADVNLFDGGRSHGNMNRTARAPVPVAAPGVQFTSPEQVIQKSRPGASANIERPQINNPIRPEVPQTPAVQQAVGQASRVMQWTPEFKDIVARANPQITSKLDSSGLVRLKAAGTFGYKDGSIKPVIPGIMDTGFQGQQQLSLDPKYTDPLTLTHEGLHAAFQDDPGTPSRFGPIYNQAAKQDPFMGKYLQNRTGGYAATKNGPENFNDYNTLQPSIKNEVHSYLSEYPTYGGRPMPKALDKYYSRYINPDLPGTVRAVRTINKINSGRMPRITRPKDK